MRITGLDETVNLSAKTEGALSIFSKIKITGNI
jgi:hypothetical protein